MQPKIKIYTYLRSRNQRNNSSSFIKLYYKDAKIEDLEKQFFNKSKIFKGLYFLKLLGSCVFTTNIIVVGDFRLIPFYIHFLFYMSKKIILVDDGLASLWFIEASQKNKFRNKIVYFTKYVDFLNQRCLEAKVIRQEITKPKISGGKNNIIFTR